MSAYSSPLLDDYHRTGIVTAPLQRALDDARSKLAPALPGGAAAAAQPGGLVPSPMIPVAAIPTPTTPTATAISAAPAAPRLSAHEQEWTRLTAPPASGAAAHTAADTGQSGIGQIHNPWLRTPLKVLDAIGSAFVPSLTMGLPGTQLHHQMLVNAARGDVAADAENKLMDAQAQKAQEGEKAGKNWIESTTLGVDPAHPEIGPQVVQFNPATGEHRYTGVKAAAKPGEEKPTNEWMESSQLGIDPDHPETGPQTVQFNKYTGEHRYTGVKAATKPPTTLLEKAISDHPDWTADRLQDFLTKEPKAAQLSAEDQAVLMSVGGDPGKSIIDQPRAIVSKFLEKKKEPAPERPPQAMMIGPDGTAINVRPGMKVPSGAMTPGGMSTENETPAAVRQRQAQAAVIKDAGDKLIESIEKHRDKLGNVGSYWNQFANGSPIADKDTAGLMAQIASFAALQPTLHGFRGQQALAQFEKIIGGVPKNPDALEAAIKAIQGTAGIIQNIGRGTGEAPIEYVRDPKTGKLILKQP